MHCLLFLSLLAEVPPHVEWTAPKMNDGGVPTNTRVWIVGQTLYAGDVKATLEEEKGGAKVDAKLAPFPVEDISSVSRVPRKPGWTGASRVRYLFELTPTKPLKPRTWYKVTYAIWDRKETFRFETGDGPDESAPSVEPPTGVRAATEGLSYTLFNVGEVKDDHLFPVRLDYYVGDDAKSARLVGYSFRKASGTGVLRGDVTSCVFVRAVDLAGNASAMSACGRKENKEKSNHIRRSTRVDRSECAPAEGIEVASRRCRAGTEARREEENEKRGAEKSVEPAKKSTSCACAVGSGAMSLWLWAVVAGGAWAVSERQRRRD